MQFIRDSASFWDVTFCLPCGRKYNVIWLRWFFSKQTILIRNDMFLLKEDLHIWRVFLNSNKKTDSVFLKQKITKSFKTVHNFHLIWLVPNCNRLYPMKFTKLVLSYFVDVFKCTGSINTLSVLTLKNVRHPSATHED